jgi:hypothetical protein
MILRLDELIIAVSFGKESLYFSIYDNSSAP